jgi:hypothetical protein
MTKRLALLALLAGVLAAVPGPHDSARAAVPGTNGRIALVRSGRDRSSTSPMTRSPATPRRT